MPYFIDPAMPGWEAFWTSQEDPAAAAPPDGSTFKYVEPLMAGATVLAFGRQPAPEPRKPFEPEPEPRDRRRAWGTRFGIPKLPDDWVERYEKERRYEAARALWEVSVRAVECRAKGVRRIFGRYNGGNDESFASLLGSETIDGRRADDETGDYPMQWLEMEELVEKAVDALMGSYGAGEFALEGAVTIDVEACEIIDEKDRDLVFRQKR